MKSDLPVDIGGRFSYRTGSKERIESKLANRLGTIQRCGGRRMGQRGDDARFCGAGGGDRLRYGCVSVDVRLRLSAGGFALKEAFSH